jgi:hypothetical protein
MSASPPCATDGDETWTTLPIRWWRAAASTLAVPSTLIDR